MNNNNNSNNITISYVLLAFFEQHKLTKLVTQYPTILEANPSSYGEELVNDILEFMNSEYAGLFPNDISTWNKVRVKYLQYQMSGSATDKDLFLKYFRTLAYRMKSSQKGGFNEKLLFSLITLNYFTKEEAFRPLVAHFMAESKIKDSHVIKSAMTFIIGFLQQTNPDLLPQLFDAAQRLKYNNEPAKTDSEE